MSNRRRPQISGWHVVALDLFGLAVALNVFALFHHVLPVYIGKAQMHIISVGLVTTDPSPSVLPDESVIPTLSEVMASVTAIVQPTYAPGDFSANFPIGDTGGTLKSYQSDNVRIAIDKLETNNVTGYIADVWVRNISFFQTGFAQGTYGKGIREYPQDMANDYNAILAVTGITTARAEGGSSSATAICIGTASMQTPAFFTRMA